MMMDIFSTFDPSNSSLYFTSTISFWLISLLPALLITSTFWLSPTHFHWITLTSLATMFLQTKRVSGYALKPFASILPIFFFIIVIINLLGLAPYLFSISSHLMFTLSLGFPMWVSLMVSAIIFNPKSVTANLLPSGAPDWLSPALVLIESTSMVIRPITLCFRLAANMTAGHIVLSLIGVYASAAMFNSTLTATFMITIIIGYTIFEVGICLIQAYIFCLLLSLYSEDHPLS